MVAETTLLNGSMVVETTSNGGRKCPLTREGNRVDDDGGGVSHSRDSKNEAERGRQLADRQRLISIIKAFHISRDNAELLVVGALEFLSPDELRAVISRAKASNADRDALQAAIGEAVNAKRAARDAGVRETADAERDAGERDRQDEDAAVRQAEHDERYAADPAYRINADFIEYIRTTKTSAPRWLEWLPGAIERAGPEGVEAWHSAARDGGEEDPLPFLRDRLAEHVATNDDAQAGSAVA